MTNIHWFERKAHTRNIEDIFGSEWELTKGRAKKEGLVPVSDFANLMATYWTSNGDKPIDKLIWDKAMGIIKGQFPSATTPDWEDTVAYEILNKGR